MATDAEIVAEGTAKSSMYELFMGLMTILSLGVMALIILAQSPEVDGVLYGADTLFCLIFLFDFALSLKRAPSKVAYLFGPRPGRSLPQGIVDLLGSIPSVGIFRAFRIFRFARIARLVRAKGSTALAREFVNRRAESAIYIIITAAMLVLLFGSATIAFLEPDAEGSNIANGADAFWWAFVTITTVGYGDRFPVTEAGRVVGMLTMAVGIGIFGVLTSYLSSVFMAPASSDDDAVEVTRPSAAAGSSTIESEISALRDEIAELRRALTSVPPRAPGP
jgi:voltage-gated potassium channel